MSKTTLTQAKNMEQQKLFGEASKKILLALKEGDFTELKEFANEKSTNMTTILRFALKEYIKNHKKD